MFKQVLAIIFVIVPTLCQADLVAHWPLDEVSGRTAQEVVNGRNGVLKNFPANGVQWEEGKIGGALRFDGINDYVEHFFNLPRDRGTLMHWVRPDTDSTGIIYYENDFPAEDADYNGFNSGGPVLEIHTFSDGRYGFYYQDGEQENISSRNFINPNGWNHVAVTWDVTEELVLYVNCEEVNRDNLADETFDKGVTSNRYFGRGEHDPETRSFKGLLDDVRVYDHVMAPEEISEFCDLNAGRHSAIAAADGNLADASLAGHICDEILAGAGIENIKDITLIVNSPYGGGFLDGMKQVFGEEGQCSGIPWVAAAAGGKEEVTRGWSDEKASQNPVNRLGSAWTQALAGDGYGNVDDAIGAIHMGSEGNNVLQDLETTGKNDLAGDDGLGLEKPQVAYGNGGELIQWRGNGTRHVAILFGGIQSFTRHQNNLTNVRNALEQTWTGENPVITTINGGTSQDLLDSISQSAETFDNQTQLLIYVSDNGSIVIDFAEAFGELEDFQVADGTQWDFRLHPGWLEGIAGNLLSDSPESINPGLIMDISHCQSCSALGYFLNGRKLEFPSGNSTGLVEIPISIEDLRVGRNRLEITPESEVSSAQSSNPSKPKPQSSSLKFSRLELTTGPINDLELNHKLKPGQSAAFFDPDRSGEGVFVELLDDQRAVVYVFSYDAEDPVQSWMVGTGKLVGNGIVVTEMYQPRGASFGPDFDPAAVDLRKFGSLVMQLPDCDGTGNPGELFISPLNGDFSQLKSSNFVQLTKLVDCSTGEQSDNAGWSGSWYDPTHNGEGIILEVLTNGQGLVQWFTYDLSGNPMWVQGIGLITGSTLTVDSLFTTSGTRWGNGFDSDAVNFRDWGSLKMVFDGCDIAQVDYESTAGFGSGTLNMQRLTRLLGITCSE